MWAVCSHFGECKLLVLDEVGCDFDIFDGFDQLVVVGGNGVAGLALKFVVDARLAILSRW